MTNKPVRKDKLTRSSGVSFSSGVLSKLIRFWDPRLGDQTGQTLFEEIASINGTLGSSSGVDAADPAWYTGTASLGTVTTVLVYYGANYVTIPTESLPVTSYINDKLLHKWGHYDSGTQTVVDGVGDLDLQKGSGSGADAADPTWTLGSRAYSYDGGDYLTLAESVTNSRTTTELVYPVIVNNKWVGVTLTADGYYFDAVTDLLEINTTVNPAGVLANGSFIYLSA